MKPKFVALIIAAVFLSIAWQGISTFGFQSSPLLVTTNSSCQKVLEEYIFDPPASRFPSIKKASMTFDEEDLRDPTPKIGEFKHFDGECPIEDLSSVDYTLVTYLHMDKAWMISHMCRRWGGPIVVVLLVHDTTKPIPMVRCKHLRLMTYTVRGHYVGNPLNLIRNLGVFMVKTTHFILTDIDVWPDVTLYPRLQSLLVLNQTYVTNSNKALVVPTFDLLVDPQVGNQFDHNQVPKNFSELATCLSNKRCSIINHGKSVEDHHTTNYKAWFLQKENHIRKIPCFKSAS